MLLGPPNSGASLIRPESHKSRFTASSHTCTLGCSLHCPSAAHPPSLGNIRAIELEIDARTATIMCPLRRLRNAHIPAGKLPDEVLVQIFGSWIKDDPFSLRAQLTLAGVSHRWRNVMSRGAFWSFIRIRDGRQRACLQDTSSPPLTDSYRCTITRVLLEKASLYPISVDISLYQMDDDATNMFLDDIKQVLAYAPRIREFSYSCISSLVLHFDIHKMLQEFKPDFRTMRAFKVVCCDLDAYNVDHFFPHGLPPSLIELSLYHCFIDWNHFQTLTLSKLHILLDGIDIPLDWRSIMVRLAPFLRDFTFMTTSISTVSPGPTIHMTQLEDLSLGLEKDSVLSFIEHLQLPTSARVFWRGDNSVPLDEPRLEELIPFVNSHFGRVIENSTFSLSCLDEGFIIAMNEGNGRMTIERCIVDPERLDGFISELDPAIAWGFTTLTFHERLEYLIPQRFPWRALSSLLPRASSIALKTERILYEAAPRALTSSLVNAWATSNKNVIFPMVTHLRLMGTRLDDVEQTGEQQLLAALRARRRAGRPLTHIHLDESSKISQDMRRAIGPHTKVFIEDRAMPARGYDYDSIKVWTGSRLRAQLCETVSKEEQLVCQSIKTNESDENYIQSSDESDSIYDGLVTQLLGTQ